jgi:hypothetical protein
MDEDNKDKQDEEAKPKKAKKETSAPKPAAVKSKKPKRKAVVLPVRRTVSFEKWAAKRDVKQRHKLGMLAFVQNPEAPRTIEEWDSLFEAY